MATNLEREIMNLPALDDVEFGATWHNASGHVSAYRHCMCMLNESAAKLFTRHQDSEAELVRGLADSVHVWAVDHEHLLNACIEEEQRRHPPVPAKTR